MGIFELIKKNISKMRWYDVSLIKLSVLSFALFIVSIWDAFRNLVLSISPY